MRHILTFVLCGSGVGLIGGGEHADEGGFADALLPYNLHPEGTGFGGHHQARGPLTQLGGAATSGHLRGGEIEQRGAFLLLRVAATLLTAVV